MFLSSVSFQIEIHKITCSTTKQRRWAECGCPSVLHSYMPINDYIAHGGYIFLDLINDYVTRVQMYLLSKSYFVNGLLCKIILVYNTVFVKNRVFFGLKHQKSNTVIFSLYFWNNNEFILWLPINVYLTFIVNQ